MSTPNTGVTVKLTILVTGIFLIAANLRVPVTAVPPLLGQIQADYGLANAAAGALTTLPLLAFALFSPISALLARQYGLERTLFAALLLIVLGMLVRLSAAPHYLYLGTWIIGMGISLGNVLLPSLIKRDFPHNIPALTGAYLLVMAVVAALGSALITPLAQRWGWRLGLGSFLCLPLLAALLWIPQLGDHTRPTKGTATAPGRPIWQSPLAWQVTLFLGLNSAIYYVIIAWLPSLLMTAGWAPEKAGQLHGAMQLAGALPGLTLVPLLRRRRDLRLPAMLGALLSAIALVGLAVLPQMALLWSLLFGFGTAAGMLLGLSFIGLRTHNAQQAAALSGMAQCLGYLLAAVGPMAAGALKDASHGWALPIGLCVALALTIIPMGALAGRNRQIG